MKCNFVGRGRNNFKQIWLVYILFFLCLSLAHFFASLWSNWHFDLFAHNACYLAFVMKSKPFLQRSWTNHRKSTKYKDALSTNTHCRRGTTTWVSYIRCHPLCFVFIFGVSLPFFFFFFIIFYSPSLSLFLL